MAVIDNILKCVEEKGLSQIQFANALAEYNVTKQKITDWKSGKSNSYYSIIVEIADYLNVTTDSLLRGIPYTKFSQDGKPLTDEEQEIIELYNQLDKMEKTIVKGKIYEFIKAK